MDSDQKVPKEITDENFLDGDKRHKSLDSWIWMPNRKPHKYTPRYSIVKFMKTKDKYSKILKRTRDKSHFTYWRKPIKTK